MLTGRRWRKLRVPLLGYSDEIVQLQVVRRDALSSQARDQYVREIELKPRRGPILDRNGVTLAADVEAERDRTPGIGGRMDDGDGDREDQSENQHRRPLIGAQIVAGDVETARRYLNAAHDCLAESRGECR